MPPPPADTPIPVTLYHDVPAIAINKFDLKADLVIAYHSFLNDQWPTLFLGRTPQMMVIAHSDEFQTEWDMFSGWNTFNCVLELESELELRHFYAGSAELLYRAPLAEMDAIPDSGHNGLEMFVQMFCPPGGRVIELPTFTPQVAAYCVEQGREFIGFVGTEEHLEAWIQAFFKANPHFQVSAPSVGAQNA